MKPILWVAIAALAAVGGGWIWGASGKSTIETERRALELRADLSEARALILGARVHLFGLDFGSSAKSFGAARQIVERVQIRLRESGQAERAGRAEIVLAHLKDAERMSLALDPGAQTAADQAVQALARL